MSRLLSPHRSGPPRAGPGEGDDAGRAAHRAGALVAGVLGIGALVVASSPVSASAAGQSVVRWGSDGVDTFPLPTSVTIPDGSSVVQVLGSNSSGYALMADGTEWAWGANPKGELGDGSTASSEGAAVQVQFPPGTDIVAIGEGFDSGTAIDTTGQAWGWGNGTAGQLCGVGGDVPSPIRGLDDVTAVAGGGDHTLWLTTAGTVEACGSNVFGDLGNGGRHKSAHPVTVQGLSAVVSISAGDHFSGAVTGSGQAYMWGAGMYGQLGDGQFANASTPQPLMLSAPVSQLYLGGSLPSNGHACALAGGVAYCWGNDRWGQLGDGETIDSADPVPVSVPSGVVPTEIAAGGASSYLLDTSGDVWSWGDNVQAQLGNGRSGGKDLVPHVVLTGAFALSATASNVVAASDLDDASPVAGPPSVATMGAPRTP